MRWLVTGGCGFIGSNFIRWVLTQHPDVCITNLDALTYAGNPENLVDIADNPRYRFVRGDICDRECVGAALEPGPVAAILNFAAESHVDRSILDSGPFVRTNVMGTQVLLDAARAHQVPRFLQVSTDEVYGSLGADGLFCETTPLAPNSPYAASKAAADLLVRSYGHTFTLPTIITRCSNNYGPYQFPEKLIPLMVANALSDQPLPVYGDGRQVRDWIHVDDHCRGIFAALTRGKPGEIYNFGGDSERENLQLVQTLLDLVGKPHSLIRFVQDRPGHDRRYAIDFQKARLELGWTPEIRLEAGLASTVEWFRSHQEWTARIRSGAYRQYYEQQYANRWQA